MSERQAVEQLDPAYPAPVMVLDNRAAMDTPGHGWELPLIGKQRPYVYDVVYDNDNRRAYADTIGDVLGVVIDGFSEASAEREEAENGADRDRTQAALRRCFDLLHSHASGIRVHLQQGINAAAQANGTWDTLDEEEQEQCTLAAQGQIPVGVLYEVPMDDGNGNTFTIDQGLWSHREVKLVVNRGDYGLFDPDFVPEPESDLLEETPDGRLVVFGGRWPANMVILDPTDEESYLESLEHAGVLQVRMRPVDLPDNLYLDAVQAGYQILGYDERVSADADHSAGNGTRA